MPGFIHEGRILVEMLLCEKQTHEVFRCDAPDPRTFPRRAGEDKSDLPFKYIGDTLDDHLIAGEGYARALRRNLVTGDPYYLLKAEMSIDNFLRSLARGDIVVYAGQCTVGFRKVMTVEHYPGIVMWGRELNDLEGADILEKVYAQKPNLQPKRKVCEESGEAS